MQYLLFTEKNRNYISRIFLEIFTEKNKNDILHITFKKTPHEKTILKMYLSKLKFYPDINETEKNIYKNNHSNIDYSKNYSFFFRIIKKAITNFILLIVDELIILNKYNPINIRGDTIT